MNSMTHSEALKAFSRIQRTPRANEETYYAGSDTVAKISRVPAVIGGDLYRVTVLRWDIDGYAQDHEARRIFGERSEAIDHVYSLAPDIRPV